jgi:hypothetical protein
VSDGGIIATGKHRGRFRRMHRMLERQAYSRPGSASRAAADGVHHHQDGAVSRLEKPVDIGRGPGFFDAVLGKICPHGGDKVLRVCHALILTADQPLSILFDSETAF